jgi:hypothetical protein
MILAAVLIKVQLMKRTGLGSPKNKQKRREKEVLYLFWVESFP